MCHKIDYCYNVSWQGITCFKYLCFIVSTKTMIKICNKVTKILFRLESQGGWLAELKSGIALLNRNSDEKSPKGMELVIL